MTEADERLFELKFKGLAELFEEKLKASETIICNKMSSIEKNFTATKLTIDTHVAWHERVNRRIVAGTIKYGLIVFGVVIITVLILGVKGGVIPSVLAKVLG